LDYADIYVRELGADPVQLGIVNSLAGIGNTILAIPVGWMHDKYSLRKLFLFGRVLLVFSSLFYALAFDWIMIVPAIVLARVSMRFHCGSICDISLKNEDRATGKALCEGVGSIPSLAAPTIAALLIAFFGGISSEGIRPLYWIQFITRCGLFVYIVVQLTEIVRPKIKIVKSSFIDTFHEVFDRGTALKRWILFSTLGTFVMYMSTPFRYPFAHEIKGAEPFIIGCMATATIAVRVLFSTPIGRLADKLGRKKLFYILTPFVCVSHLLLVFAPSSEFLIISAVLFGFRMITMIVVQGAMSAELVPIDCIGRWRGVLGLFGGLASIPAPIIGGIVWESLGPIYVFLIPVVIDLLIRIPLMFIIPETLQRNR
jgi:MFS family permease